MPNTNDRLVSAIYAVFQPLASLLLRNGMTAAPVVELLKVAFADVARRKYGKGEKPASVNRISQVTGLSRNHVRGLLDKRESIPSRDELGAPVEAAILARWTGSEGYVDKLGRPRILELGPGPGTFAELVKTATGEEASLKYLGRLSQAGCVSILDDERIKMVRREFIFAHDLPQIFAKMLVPLLTTISSNWDEEYENRYCIRVTHSDRVDPAWAGMFRRVSRDRISRFLEDMDDLITSKELETGETSSDKESEALMHLGVGAYYFEMDK